MADAPESPSPAPAPAPSPSLLFPKEVIDVLNMDFYGFKMWHLLIIALVMPYPAMFVAIFMLIPGFKEKVTELIKNGRRSIL